METYFDWWRLPGGGLGIIFLRFSAKGPCIRLLLASNLTLMEKLVSPRQENKREGSPERGNSTRRLDFQSSVHPWQLCIDQLWKSGAGERGRLTIYSIYRHRLEFTYKLADNIFIKETLWVLIFLRFSAKGPCIRLILASKATLLHSPGLAT